jgi:acyl carrier protein
MEDIMFENLKQFIVEEFKVNPDDVTPEAELVGDLGINSLELADLVYLCEEKFNISIDDEDLHNFNTVGDVVRYIEAAQK